ncbi:MAG: M17 family peptidase N-terminal domain-containing protein, partial [Chloroflexota bacterium]|nr:M17 family peptidase N-terminal domain-containing protein [Chloroflexota bacterium]
MVNLFEGVEHPGGATGAVDQALDGAISKLVAEGEIKGKLNEVTIIHTLGKIAPARVVIVGLGKQESFTLDKIRGVAAAALKHLRKIGVERVTTITHGAGIAGLEAEKAAQALVEGSILGLYTFRKHITKEPEFGEIKELVIVERDESKLSALERGCIVGRIMAEATDLARDMINEPGNSMTPTDMAEIAKKVAEDWGLEYEVLERGQMQELGMGALLGVAQGSRQPPKLIRLSYKGGGEGTLGILGKGITFDSGGISIKPAQGMGEMKGDMAGGAAVIAAMRAIGELKLHINVTGLIPATENL